MKLISPDYYTSFSCIADKCRHSCCIGWEIDIDPETATYYNSLGGKLGERLRECISYSDGDAHFILSENEHCPFLSTSGLCEIITQAGENALCDICTDHPRFRSFFSDRTEIGLGLCCEEAARIILSEGKPVSLIVLEEDNSDDVCSDEELAFFKVRDRIFDIALDSSLTVSQKLVMFHNDFEVSIPDKTLSQWADVFLSLEHLSNEWPCFLSKLKSFSDNELSFIDSPRWQCQYSRLLHYFLFRHLSDADSNVDFRARIGFAMLSVQMIAALFVCNDAETFDSLADIARMYSSEIEYSDENLDYIIDMLKVDLYV